MSVDPFSAFVDDLVGLIIGPLFVVAEWAFALGLRPEVRQAVEARVGGMRRRMLENEHVSS